MANSISDICIERKTFPTPFKFAVLASFFKLDDNIYKG